DVRLSRTDHLLLRAADRTDRAIGTDHPGGGDLVAVVDVPTALFEDLEREGETRGRAADVAQVELDLQRNVQVERRLRLEADHGARVVEGVSRRRDVDGPGRPVADERDWDDVADLVARQDLVQVEGRADTLVIGRHDDVVR